VHLSHRFVVTDHQKTKTKNQSGGFGVDSRGIGCKLVSSKLGIDSITGPIGTQARTCSRMMSKNYTTFPFIEVN
jgi:hypothetical protein